MSRTWGPGKYHPVVVTTSVAHSSTHNQPAMKAAVIRCRPQKRLRGGIAASCRTGLGAALHAAELCRCSTGAAEIPTRPAASDVVMRLCTITSGRPW